MNPGLARGNGIEHVIIALIVESIAAIDRRLQRPLDAVIPEAAKLWADPRQYLAQFEVRIGPRRRHALSTFWGIVAGLAVVVILIVLFANGPRPRRLDGWRIAGWLASFVVVMWAVRALMSKWLHGGTATLRSEGVELNYREKSVFLPWSLFRVGGSIFEPDGKLAVVPIDPTVPVAMSGNDSDEQVRAVLPNELSLPQARSGDTGQVSLADLYEVRIGEFAVLLLDLGRRLHGGPAEEAPATFTSVPMAVRDKDNWLTIQLTQLPFPPFCTGCGELTGETYDVVAMKFGQSNTKKFGVPFCAACARNRRRLRIIGALIGAAIAVVIAIPLAIWLAPMGPVLLVVIIALALGLGIPGAVIGQAIGREVGSPVRCRDYKPEKGTIRMQLRDPHRAGSFLQAMGLPTQPEPEVVEMVN